MSRIGKLPVPVDSQVKVDYSDRVVTVKGPKGEVSFETSDIVELQIGDAEIKVIADFKTESGRRVSGTTRSLINNMVQGVTVGFSKTLELNGVGYRAQLQGRKLTMSLGFSHPVEYELPPKVECQLESNTKMIFTSCDKQLLGQVAAEIRRHRPPEPYKGKGILFAGEVVRRKVGKTAKSST